VYTNKKFAKEPEQVAYQATVAYSILYSGKEAKDALPALVKDSLVEKEMNAFFKQFKYLQEAKAKTSGYIV
jgi:hypothetical protein